MNCFDSHLSCYRYRTHSCLVCARKSWSNDSFRRKCLRALNLNRQHLDFLGVPTVDSRAKAFIGFRVFRGPPSLDDIIFFARRLLHIHLFKVLAQILSRNEHRATAAKTKSIKVTTENNLLHGLWTLSWCQSDTLTLHEYLAAKWRFD